MAELNVLADRKISERGVSEKTLEELSEEVFFDRNNRPVTLLEAEFFTHRTSEVVDMIRKKIESEIKNGTVVDYRIESKSETEKENTYPILRISCVTNGLFDLESFLKIRLPYYGWYVGFFKSNLKKIDDGIVDMQTCLVEPKIPSNDRDVSEYTEMVVSGSDAFYHVTRSRFADKIERTGLIPSKTDPIVSDDGSTKKMRFDHPDRIYLFSDLGWANEYAKILLSPESVGGRLEQTNELNKRFSGNGFEADARYQDPNAGIVIFSVDLKRLLRDGRPIHLYHDDRAGINGVAYFTMNPIPPKYLKRISSIPADGNK